MNSGTRDDLKIGILAGMGPRSTAPFIDLVVSECQRQYGAKDDIDFPKMMIYSLPTPFVAGQPVDHARMESTLLAGLRELEQAGVSFAAIACNTAHAYYPKLAMNRRSPLLDMVELTLASLPESPRKVALIAARPTIESGIYQAGLRARGHIVIEPPQPQVDLLIESTRSDSEPDWFTQAWASLIQSAETSGAEAILIACLDLSAVSKYIPGALPIIDSARCLAAGIVARWLEESPYPRPRRATERVFRALDQSGEPRQPSSDTKGDLT